MDIRTKRLTERAEALANSIWDKRASMRPESQDAAFVMMEELRTAARRLRQEYKAVMDFTVDGALGMVALTNATAGVALQSAVLESLTKVAEVMLKEYDKA